MGLSVFFATSMMASAVSMICAEAVGLTMIMRAWIMGSAARISMASL